MVSKQPQYIVPIFLKNIQYLVKKVLTKFDGWFILYTPPFVRMTDLAPFGVRFWTPLAINNYI